MRDFAAIDFETANNERSSVCSVGVVIVRDGEVINVIVDNLKGGLSFCDVAVSDDLEKFNANYLHLTETINQTCQDILDDEAMIVGTSAVTGTELDSLVNQYSGIFNNPSVPPFTPNNPAS